MNMDPNTPHGLRDVLSSEQRAALESLGTPVQFPSQETIFRAGQPSHSVLLIQRGHVKVTHTASDGSQVILAVRGPDEIMGDEGVLMGEPRSATVTTISEVTGLDVGADDLLHFVNTEGLWPEMYRAVVRRRRESDKWALSARLDVRSRLATLLLELATEVGEQDEAGMTIKVALSQQDLAGRIGASRDAVAMELRKLREQGLITTGRHRIILHKLDELRSIASPRD
ncbi:Crp/Fnr family transcriptional regulator [Nocardiopsis dassonvillei]|uniref:Crp/Fnr family transcriptional regulator n=1 Tax=Nocardiopsis dassonvillei TaxID=2014 RepID=UPI0013EF0067|nr:Crp/Fnr family transcriptional regulator [Nocardiopsis dassonvillei]MCP3017176.1 Crp/Fnr family transcriptional regulator [Nocardiopsis dassonvillei]